MQASKRLSALDVKDWLFIFSSLVIAIGLILSIVSWLRICSDQCAPTHNYRLFGIQFESIGLVFFPLLTACHFLSRKYEVCDLLTGILLASAVGAEIIFIDVQKRDIGHWCPVCLSIAGCVVAAAIAYAVSYLISLNSMIKEGQKGEIMQKVWKIFGSIMCVFLGLFLAYVGVGKADQLKAQEDSIKDRIVFGKSDSPVDVYIFTDWQCPACRSIEPTLVKIAPDIETKSPGDICRFYHPSRDSEFHPLQFVIYDP